MKKFEVVKNLLTKDDLELLLDSVLFIRFRPCPKWLGNFQFKVYDKNTDPPPKEIIQIANKVIGLVDNQKFNTIFLQKYEYGEYVKPHIDPRNNVGKTIIVPFGEYTGGLSIIEGETIDVSPGDVLVQDCTNGYSMGPKHSVSKIESGMRFALILNSIVEIKYLEE